MNRSSVVRWFFAGVVVAAACTVHAGLDDDVFGYEAWQRALSEIEVDQAQVVYPFHITEEMRAWAKEKIRPYRTASPEVRLQVLQLAFFDPGEFSFEYEQERTLTATEAFASRRGNCMSFTSLFVALSRSLDLPTFLVAVTRRPEVVKDGGLVVVNRHVVAGFRHASKVYIYDFYFNSNDQPHHRQVIDDVAASAMYHTNIGGMNIRMNDTDAAIHNLEIATTISPSWAPAWVNLGVARARAGDMDAALDAYQMALVAEPNNSSALVNMAKVFTDQGQIEEAHTAMRAAAEGSRNPFTLIAMADVEMLHGNLDEARQYLRRARWWYSGEPEVYEAMSRLARLGEQHEKADKYLAKASALRQRGQVEADSLN